MGGCWEEGGAEGVGASLAGDGSGSVAAVMKEL